MTFVSNLVAAGVHPRVAQALARHAKVETTMAVYADLTALDLRGRWSGRRCCALAEPCAAWDEQGQYSGVTAESARDGNGRERFTGVHACP